jgi:hypothetical protein
MRTVGRWSTGRGSDSVHTISFCILVISSAVLAAGALGEWVGLIALILGDAGPWCCRTRRSSRKSGWYLCNRSNSAKPTKCRPHDLRLSRRKFWFVARSQDVFDMGWLGVCFAVCPAGTGTLARGVSLSSVNRRAIHWFREIVLVPPSVAGAQTAFGAAISADVATIS